jgi:hypothetical protein
MGRFDDEDIYCLRLKEQKILEEHRPEKNKRGRRRRRQFMKDCDLQMMARGERSKLPSVHFCCCLTL